jgi:hypothetical protein
MKKEQKNKIEGMLFEIERIEDLIKSHVWDVENQDLPNIEEMNDAISDAISTLEGASTSNEFERISTDDIDSVKEKVEALKDDLTEMINSISEEVVPDKDIMFNGYNTILKSASYLNHILVTNLNNVAASIYFSSAPNQSTYHQFYLLMCTLETQLQNMFGELVSLAEENEIRDISDYVITVRLESKRDLEKHKRNNEMEENNNGN